MDKRTTRRVMAQRKFAQGAYVPPVANASANPVASTSGTAPSERRELTSHELLTNVFLNKIQARNILDFVCFRDKAIFDYAHFEPVVLVERLREKRRQSQDLERDINGDNSLLRVRHIAKPVPVARRSKQRCHKMILRTREQRFSLKRYQPGVYDKPRKVFKGTKRLPPGKKYRHLEPKRIYAPSHRNSVSTDFSLDDNRPLNYFVNLHKRPMTKFPENRSQAKKGNMAFKSQTKNYSALRLPVTQINEWKIMPIDYRSSRESSIVDVETVMGPPMLIPRPMQPPPRPPQPPPTPPQPQEFIREDSIHLDNLSTKDEIISIVSTSGKYSSDIIKLDRVPNVMHKIVDGQSITITQSAIDAALASRANEMPRLQYVSEPSKSESSGFKVETIKPEPTAPTYYTVQAINRWMDGSLQDDASIIMRPDLPKSTKSKKSTGVQSQHGEIHVIDSSDDEEPQSGCPASKWKTVEDVTSARPGLYKSRCTLCPDCVRIGKVEKLSRLLVENAGNVVHQPISNKARTKYFHFYEEPDWAITDPGAEDIYIELLPRHDILVMKVTKKKVFGKEVFSACLIPKEQAKPRNKFLLIEHENLLDELIEAFSISKHTHNAGRATGRKIERTTASRGSRRCRSLDSYCGPNKFRSKFESIQRPRHEDVCRVLQAPTYWLTPKYYNNPMGFLDVVCDKAKDYGICKIVLPPNFLSECNARDDIRFEVTNQYISRLFKRWGPGSREICAIKSVLKQQKIIFQRAPKVDGVEINLPKLYHVVQRHGGLEIVMEKKRWNRVANDMGYMANPINERRLDQLYLKYVLPYDVLTSIERTRVLRKVERSWLMKTKSMLKRTRNPLHKKKRLLGESDTSASDTGEDETEDIEDCIRPGINMTLDKFKKIANNTKTQLFGKGPVPSNRIEQAYWETVLTGKDHVCVNSASIDTKEQDIGFPTLERTPVCKHPWNFKNLGLNPSNIVSLLGSVMGVTVPTLHLGMVFSTSCWHRDPHALCWCEFSHQGEPVIWYGIPEEGGESFRAAIETLCPTTAQNKSLWLSSDIIMVPPGLLEANKVTVYRVEQKPGEIVIVLPRAYSCSINTGFTMSESVYFANESWLDQLRDVFAETLESCEPTMFALEQILKGVAEDPSSNTRMLSKIHSLLEATFLREINNRERLIEIGISIDNKPKISSYKGKKGKPSTASYPTEWNYADGDECEVCRRSLYLSKVKNLPHMNAMVCLSHALELLAKDKTFSIDTNTLELHFRFSTEELFKTIKIIKDRLIFEVDEDDDTAEGDNDTEEMNGAVPHTIKVD